MRTPHDNNVIIRAKILLRETDKSLRDIALRLLFSGAPAFCSYFRKRVGVGAQQFRDGAKATMSRNSEPAQIDTTVVCEFTEIAQTEKTMWLYESHIPLTDDILDMSASYIEVEYIDGSILRSKQLQRVEFKSAMQRIDAKVTLSKPNRRTEVRVSLAQQTGELDFSVVSVIGVRRITVELSFTTLGPR